MPIRSYIIPAIVSLAVLLPINSEAQFGDLIKKRLKDGAESTANELLDTVLGNPTGEKKNSVGFTTGQVVFENPDDTASTTEGFNPANYKDIAVLVHDETGLTRRLGGVDKRISSVFRKALMEKGYKAMVRDDESMARVLLEVKRQSSPITGQQKAQLGKFKNISAILFVEITKLGDSRIQKEKTTYRDGRPTTRRVYYRKSEVELTTSIVNIEAAEYVWMMGPQLGYMLEENGQKFNDSVITGLSQHIANNKIPDMRTKHETVAESPTAVSKGTAKKSGAHEVKDLGKMYSVKIAHETTLAEIAKLQKFPLPPLADYNGLEASATLQVGDTVFVPK